MSSCHSGVGDIHLEESLLRVVTFKLLYGFFLFCLFYLLFKRRPVRYVKIAKVFDLRLVRILERLSRQKGD